MIIILGLCIFILIICLFMIGFLLLTNIEYAIIPVIVALGLVILIRKIFYSYVRKYPLNDTKDFISKNIYKLVVDSIDFWSISFILKEGVWICEKNGEKVALDLKGFIFPKSFIRAYVIRNLRYKTIDKKTPLYQLYANKYRIDEFKNKDIKLQLCDDSSYVVRDGVSIYGFISREITKSRSRYMFNTNRSLFSAKKNIVSINEKIYLTYDNNGD